MELMIPTPEQLREAYETDLKASFPPSELKPLAVIEALWAAGCYLPLCLYDGRERLGECFLWQGEAGWILLDYLAVTPERRSGGLGSLMLKKMRETYPDQVILAEAETPAEAPDSRAAERRLDFYRRSGARLAAYDSRIFGVRYHTLYWAPGPLSDGELALRHRRLYRSRIPEKYEKQIRIPLEETSAPPDGRRLVVEKREEHEDTGF